MHGCSGMFARRGVVAVGLVCGMAVSVSSAAPGVLKLKTGDVDLAVLENDLARLARPNVRVEGRTVIQLDGPMTAERRAAIEEAGITLGSYLPDYAYVVLGGNVQNIANLGFVDWAGAFRPEWKIDPELGQRRFATAERLAIKEQGLIAMHAWLFEGADVQAARDAIAAIPGATITMVELEGREHLIQLTIPADVATKVADVEQVQWIEDAPEVTSRNNTQRWIVQSNVNGFYPVYDAGIRGEGQIIGIMDGRVNVNHCSFTDPEGDSIGDNHRKVQAYNASLGSDFHGTHVAGTALGDGGSFNDTRGVAYHARLAFDTTPSFSQSQMIARLIQHAGDGAFIHTNSWGNDFTTSYDGLARGIDIFSYDNEDHLVIFAATNGSNLRNPENSKNVLAVGGSNDTPNQNSFCTGGRGPTIDGRRKPEIFAPGCNIRSSSASGGCATTSLSGTSMAAPAIAGTAALARQYYVDGFYPSGMAVEDDGFTPSGSLIKATLLNSAVDMTNVSSGGSVFPNDREGWGRVLLDNALYLPGDDRELIIRDVRNSSGEALSTGEVYEFEVDVTSAFTPSFKVTMVYHDAPAALNANPAPVNNLDLTVIDAAGFEYLGNVFSASQGISVSGGTPDEVNNVEQVLIGAPLPGRYTIRVSGTEVSQGQQGFALVLTGAIDEVADDVCIADWNDDGVVDFFDVQQFLNAFGAQDASADLNDDGVFDFFDVQEFLNQFAIGCA